MVPIFTKFFYPVLKFLENGTVQNLNLLCNMFQTIFIYQMKIVRKRLKVDVPPKYMTGPNGL